MDKAEWDKGLAAYKNIHKQAVIDKEFAEMIIPIIEKKIKESEQDG
jgi:hypothetical protein